MLLVKYIVNEDILLGEFIGNREQYFECKIFERFLFNICFINFINKNSVTKKEKFYPTRPYLLFYLTKFNLAVYSVSTILPQNIIYFFKCTQTHMHIQKNQSNHSPHKKNVCTLRERRKFSFVVLLDFDNTVCCSTIFTRQMLLPSWLLINKANQC